MGAWILTQEVKESILFQIHFGLMGAGEWQGAFTYPNWFQIHFGLMGANDAAILVTSPILFQIHFGLMGAMSSSYTANP